MNIDLLCSERLYTYHLAWSSGEKNDQILVWPNIAGAELGIRFTVIVSCLNVCLHFLPSRWCHLISELVSKSTLLNAPITHQIK